VKNKTKQRRRPATVAQAAYEADNRAGRVWLPTDEDGADGCARSWHAAPLTVCIITVTTVYSLLERTMT